MASKRIGTFKQFLNEQRMSKLKEERVTLEVDWWDASTLEVNQILSDECGGFLEYETLVNYVKGNFQILGRPDPGYDEGFLLQHIKDLIFQLHGDSFVCDGQCNWGDNTEIQAKGLVVSIEELRDLLYPVITEVVDKSTEWINSIDLGVEIDDRILMRGVNTCILSVALAARFDLSKEELLSIGFASIFSDIGMH